MIIDFSLLHFLVDSYRVEVYMYVDYHIVYDVCVCVCLFVCVGAHVYVSIGIISVLRRPPQVCSNRSYAGRGV